MLDPVLILKAAVIGVVEGFTEFLPISSTAHIVITQRLLAFKDPGDVFAVVIQLGAILAVCAYFWRRIWHLASSLHRDPASQRFVATLAVACVPAGVLGLLLNKWLETHVFGAYAVAIIAITSAVGGVGILLIERHKPSPIYLESNTIPWRTALGIGCLQVLAMVPGVSRSGASILGGMCLGVGRQAATEFSFFLAIPVMLGASSLKLYKHRSEITADHIGIIIVGSLVSFVVALAVVHWLLRYVATHDFRLFGWYRIILGVVLAALLVAGIIPLRVN